ncbi:MAG TPA: hypothetical protein VLF14_07065, partial [Candidatus Binatia bacterium]|nr:hypothetical protein [Candidatus Binatia bacterium]
MSVSWRHIVGGTAFALVAAAALAAGALAWRLGEGPIPLAFLDPRVEATLSGLLPGVTAHVEHTELGWAAHLPELRVIGVTLVHGDRQVASFPSLGILPSLRALARGRFALHRVSLSGARLTFVRDAEGRLKLGADGAGGGEQTIDLSALLAFGSNGESAARFLRRIRIQDAVVSLDDRSAGNLWRGNDADVHIKFADQGFTVEVAAALSVASPASRIVRELVLPMVATASLARREKDGVASVAFEANVNDGRLVPAG